MMKGMKATTLTEKDDQDLVLFRDLHRRRRLPTLLQPDLSDDFEPNPGNFSLYRMASGRKGPGYEFFAENDKNDYDWLKTPPATPLFPSLEMEANAPDLLLFQRDIPILQPLSRFGSDSATARGSIGRPKSPKAKAKAVPLASRSVNPSHMTQRPSNTISLNNRKPNVKDTPDFLTSNLTKNNNINTGGAGTKPRSSSSRGVSPSPTRPTILPAGFSNETPPNLRTDISRSTSATRGRPVVPPSLKDPPYTSTNINRTADINRSTSATRGRAGATNITAVSRKQSCSPCVTRGRKQQDHHEILQPDAQKGKTRNNSNSSVGTQFVGSRMVDKLMNARSKSGNEDRSDSSTRPNSRGGSAKTTMMSRTSLNVVTSKPNMETKRYRTGVVPGKTSARE